MKNIVNTLVTGPNRAIPTVMLFLLMTVFLLVAASAAAGPAAQTSEDGIWYDVSESSFEAQGDRLIVPDRYRTIAADLEALSALLIQAPLEYTPEADSTTVLLSLPLPDGRFENFRVYNSPVMARELAAEFPEITTYRIIGQDDVYASGRLDLTPNGFHAKVESIHGT